MDNIKIATKLKEKADNSGLFSVLNVIGSNIPVRLPMTESLWNTSVDELSLSVRARNGVMRAGARTVGDVSEIIMSDAGLFGIRNLGKKTVSEIKTEILKSAYQKLNERERLEFWLFLVNNRFDEKMLQIGDPV